ncbi:hypothetical protein ACQEVG_24575 [Streptomyces sp. CA-135486]|uniref:hypothetical protein n=1 Tax=Streptomyces sp. CA-135486 TaxID=3240049 RepID=UPI003D938914
MNKTRMGVVAAMASAVMAVSTTQASAAPKLEAYTPRIVQGVVGGQVFYDGYKKVCASLLGQTLAGWVQLTHKCVTVSPNSSGSFNTTIKCPTRGAFKTWVEGTKRNGRVDVKMSGGIYLECRH